MIKMIISDMDGTLLNSSKEISQENFNSILRARAKGALFFLATGRIYTSALRYAKLLDLDTPIIACNGALIRNHLTGETLYENPVTDSVARDIMQLLDQEGIYYHFYTDTDFYTKELKYTSLAYSQQNKTLPEQDRLPLHVSPDFYQLLEDGIKIMKFVVIDDDKDRLAKVRKALDEIPSIDTSQSWYNNIEIMAKGVSKGEGVRMMAERYGVQPGQIMTLGDQENDISMISWAGYGVAMGNAEDIVKDQAEFVTATNDQDGVSLAIQKFFP